MITDHESSYGTPLFAALASIDALNADPHCEVCERSMIGRFGGEPAAVCDSCEADFTREYVNADGMIELDADDY